MEYYFDLVSRNSESLLQFFVNGLWPGLLFALIVWLVLSFARRLEASARYRIWAVALVFILAAPILTGPLPKAAGDWVASFNNSDSTVDLIDFRGKAASVGQYRQYTDVSRFSRNTIVPAPLERTGSLFRSDQPAIPAGSKIDLRQTGTMKVYSYDKSGNGINLMKFVLGMIPISAVSIWCVVSLILLGRVFWGYREVCRIKRSMVPLDVERHFIIRKVIDYSGATRPVRVGVSSLVRVPVSIGFFKPAIIFPGHLMNKLSHSDLNSITLHELAHIQRYDDWTNLFQKLVQAFLFFNPAVYLLGNRLDLEREIACDEWVVENTRRPREYARTLTRLVALTGGTWNPVLASGAALFKKQIYKRLERILHYESGHKPRKSRALAIVGAMALVVALTVQVTPVIAVPGEAIRFSELSRTIQEGWREASNYIPGLVYDDQMEDQDDYDLSHAVREAEAAHAASNVPNVIDVPRVAPVRVAPPLAFHGWSEAKDRSERGESSKIRSIGNYYKAPSVPEEFLVFSSKPAKAPKPAKPAKNWLNDTERRYRYRYDYNIKEGKAILDYTYDTVDEQDLVPEAPTVDAKAVAEYAGMIGEREAAVAEARAEFAEAIAVAGENRESIEESLRLADRVGAELANLSGKQSAMLAGVDNNWLDDIIDGVVKASEDLELSLADGSTLSITDDNEMTWNYREGSHRIKIDVDGTIDLTEDDRWIEDLGENGWIEIYERERDEVREFKAKMIGGELNYRYYENREETQFDDRAREWVGDMLLEMVRHSGIGAENRIKRIYRDGGLSAVFDEIEALGSDHVKSIYFSVLFKNDLDSDELAKAVKVIPAYIDSDYEIADILIGISDRCSENDDLMMAYTDAVSELDSDYEARRVISELSLENAENPEVLEKAMEIAMNLDSDYEKAEYLINLASANDGKAAMTEGYIRALRSLDSDYERGRVLKELIRRDELSEEYIGEILNLAEYIDSDYERAEFLIYVAQNFDLKEEKFGLYIDAMMDMDADYDVRRTLMALDRLEQADDETLVKVLRRIDYMDSDFDKAELLMAYGEQCCRNDRTGKAFLRVVEDIDSDYDISRVMISVISGNLSDEFILDAIYLAEGMSGDFDKAQVLRNLSDYCKGNGLLEDAYFDAVETISSSYERDKLYAELVRSGRDKN